MSLRTSAHAGVAIRSPKAPLADQGWCSAQRIKIEMIASGNHTTICAAPVRTLGLRGSELSSFRALSIKRGFTIPQSRACVRRASQLPLHKGAGGAPAPIRSSMFLRRTGKLYHFLRLFAMTWFFDSLQKGEEKSSPFSFPLAIRRQLCYTESRIPSQKHGKDD